MALRVVTLEHDDVFRAIIRRVIVEQLVRAATSVGSNLEEATGAQSKPDFIAKIGIARKEAREVQFWLRLGRESAVVHADDWPGLVGEAEEVSRVVAAIARSAKRSPGRGA